MKLVDTEVILYTARLELEPLQVHHAAILFDSLQDERIYKHFPKSPLNSLEELANRYAKLVTRKSPDSKKVWLNWAIKLNDSSDYIGVLDCEIREDKTATFGYILFPPYWGKGYCTEACFRILEVIFSTYEVKRIIVEIEVNNIKSIRVIEKLGFKQTSVNKGACVIDNISTDEYTYELTYKEWQTSHSINIR